MSRLETLTKYVRYTGMPMCNIQKYLSHDRFRIFVMFCRIGLKNPKDTAVAGSLHSRCGNCLCFKDNASKVLSCPD